MLAGIGVYTVWGFYPLYFQALAGVPATEIVAHRILWSVVTLAPLLGRASFRGEVVDVVRDRARRPALLLAAALILVNWLTYVLAVTSGRVLDASLGYFLAPLAMVALGVLVLRERLRAAQAVAVGLAAFAVAWLLASSGTVPWLALVLASTFALYGLVKKRLVVAAVAGMFLECLLALPAALLILAWQAAGPGLAFLDGPGWRSALLVLAGAVTFTPLILFAVAARGLPMVTLGLLQYIAPSVLFLLAVTLLGEPIDRLRIVGFALIWLALAVYSIDAWRAARR